MSFWSESRQYERAGSAGVVGPARYVMHVPGIKLRTVCDSTTYRYSAPVTFGQHRLMLRPRASHDLRLVDAELALLPHGTVRWMHDVFSNSVALVDFHEPAAELSVVSNLTIERYALARLDF